MPFIPGTYLWGNVCKQTSSASCGPCRGGGCKARGHLCSWEGTWGQEIMARRKGQLCPQVGSPGGASPAWEPCQAPGRSRKASEQPDVSPEPVSPEPTLPARAPATSCQPSTWPFSPPGGSSAGAWGCQGGRVTPVCSMIRPA